MRIFAGPHRTGLITILTALLLPVLGVGVASADMNIGDTVMLKVPDLSEFPVAVEEHQFTCRAVTEHAYWLVQDSVSVNGVGPGVLDTIVWNNLIAQGELDTLTGQFEGDGVDVYGTVTGLLGDVPDTDDDPKIWIVMATIPDIYVQDPKDKKVMTYVNPADVDGSGTFNNHDIIYLNLHSYTQNTTVLSTIAKQLRTFYMPNGIGMLIRTSVQPTEEQWITRGLGGVCQYSCYGITRTVPGNYGLYFDLIQFARNPGMDLIFYQSLTHAWDFGTSRAQATLWLMYLAQREGDAVLETIAQSTATGMIGIANAIDPLVPDSTAIQTNVVPIYMDWLICNLTNNLEDDMSGGIYMYEEFAFPDTTEFSHIGESSAFEGSFSDEDYPLEVWLPEDGMAASIWAVQYEEFTGDYTAHPTVYFNGAFSDGTGSGSLIDGRWVATVVSIDTVNAEIVSVESVSLNDFYNGSFEIAGDNAYLMVTNNYDGGLAELRYILSQNPDAPDVLLAVHQNSVNDQFLTLYTTLIDSLPEGFDWCGPTFTVSSVDTSSTFDMEIFSGSIWNCRFNAWESGDFTLQVAGYDSSGFSASSSTNISVGYVSTGTMSLNVSNIHLDVMAGAAAPGTMVSLCESSILDLSLQTQVPLEDVMGIMTGINAGPVSIPDINAILSFPAVSSEGAVYRYTVNGWEQQDSYYQAGRMCTVVSDGGNYVYGKAPGVLSPEIPAEFHFGGICPNPFSAEAAIRFSLPSAGRVNVIIYDMSGRAVRTLSDTEMQAAEHTLMWDGLDQAGNTVGAGVYFCRLQACGETVTQKMLRIE